ncbi:MAG: glycosyltransferase family 39 protein [Opitutales bacterium]|nr:glycosyltransferase family 39 protein [Opitutales bacterium]
MNEICPGKGARWLADLAVIFAVSCALYMSLSFTRPLASPDEGRYTEIPREMLAHSDMTTPRLNDMPYFYKPPMFYWMQAASLKVFGTNQFSARFANSLMAVFGICASYCAARALYGRRAGIFAAAFLATFLFYYALGQIVTLDMAVAVFISAAMFCFIVALRRSGVWRGTLTVAFFAFCALAVMTKGLIGVLIPAAAIFIYALLIGPVAFLRSLKKPDIAWIALGLAVFAAIALPWHLLAAAANPAYPEAEGIFSKKWDGQGFFWYYIIHEHVLRFIDAETSMRAQPFWFFLVLVPVGLIPWAVFLPAVVRGIFAGGWRRLRAENPEALFFLAWICFVVLFFSVSRSKLAPYIIPVYPAFAVLFGAWLSENWGKKIAGAQIAKRIFAALGILGAIAAPIACCVLIGKGKVADPSAARAMFGALSVYTLISSIALFATIRGGDDRKFFVRAFVLTAVFLLFFNPMGNFVQRPSARPLAEEILASNPSASVAVAYDYNYFQDLPVWLGRTVLMIGMPPEEQKFGFMRGRGEYDGKFFPSEKEFKEFAASAKSPVFVALRERDLGRLSGAGVSFDAVLRNLDMVLVRVKK